MKILVTGAAGMLGSGLVPALVSDGHEVVATDINLAQRRPWGEGGPELGRLDVRERDAIRDAIDQVRPDLVAHLAAETDLELCELDPDGAWWTNAIATKYVALECQRAGMPMAYISTAGVFDGTKDTAYTEFDTPNPVNVYGRSKFDGELMVEHLLDRYYIVRAGWMVGGGAKDHKFVAKILAQINAGATTLHVVSDKAGTPTYVPDFARCFSDLIGTGAYGRYHMACEGWGTRYDVSQLILTVLGRDDIELVEVPSSYFAEEFFAVRPDSEIMRNMVLDLQGMNSMRPWEVALIEYIEKEHAVLGQGVHRVIDITDNAISRRASRVLSS